MTAKRRTCRECEPASRRPAPYPGPRCATHWRAETKRRREADWARWIRRTYGIDAVEYAAILEVQGGACFICQRAVGTTKRLAVDHDHATGEVRGILCGPCNRGVIGHLRDDVDAARRVAEYLTDPPARRVLGVGKRAGFAPGGSEGGSVGESAGGAGIDALRANQRAT